MSAEQINTEEIMNQIRENIKTRDYSDVDLKFEDMDVSGVNKAELDDLKYDPAAFADEIAAVNTFYGVNYWQPMDGGGIKLAFKKFIRKFMKPVAAPLVASQNMYNNASAKSLSHVYAYIRDNEEFEAKKRVKELENKVDALEKRIEQLEKQAK